MNIIQRNPSTLAGYGPRGLDEQFGRLVEHMFDDMFSSFTHLGGVPPWSGDNPVSPRLTVTESDKAFEVQAELPGVSKDEVKVAIDRQRVTIEAESKRESEQRQGGNLLYTERGASKFMRSFMLPVEVDDATPRRAWKMAS